MEEFMYEAKMRWLYYTKQDQFDFTFRPHKDHGFGWLKRARKALKITLRAAVKGSNMSLSKFHRLERRELRGNITLAQMAEAADILNCDFEYYLKPKGPKSFVDLEWDSLWPAAMRYLDTIKPDTYNAGELGRLCYVLSNDSHFRRELQWSERGVHHDGPSDKTINRWHMAKFRAVLRNENECSNTTVDTP